MIVLQLFCITYETEEIVEAKFLYFIITQCLWPLTSRPMEGEWFKTFYLSQRDLFLPFKYADMGTMLLITWSNCTYDTWYDFLHRDVGTFFRTHLLHSCKTLCLIESLDEDVSITNADVCIRGAWQDAEINFFFHTICWDKFWWTDLISLLLLQKCIVRYHLWQWWLCISG